MNINNNNFFFLLFLFKMCTDLVPVHNDIWRKLGLSCWRVFKAKHGAILKRRQGGHEGCDPRTDQRCFSTLLPPAYGGTPQVLSYTLPPSHYTASMNFGWESARSAAVVAELWKQEQRSHWRSERPTAVLATTKARANPRVCSDAGSILLFASLFYLTTCPLIKLGRGNSELLPLLTHGPRAARRRTSTPRPWQNWSTESQFVGAAK